MRDVMSPKLRDRLNALLKREDLSTRLNSYDQGFKDVVKYLLPKLLEGPIFHLKYLFDTMDVSVFVHFLSISGRPEGTGKGSGYVFNAWFEYHVVRQR